MPIADPLVRLDEAIEALWGLLNAMHKLAESNEPELARTVRILSQQALDQTDTLRALHEALSGEVGWAS